VVFVFRAVAHLLDIEGRYSLVPARAGTIAIRVGDYGAATATLCTNATGGVEGEGTAH
jgi:hypothetical protein